MKAAINNILKITKLQWFLNIYMVNKSYDIIKLLLKINLLQL